MNADIAGPDDARAYLRQALEQKGVPLKHASELVGKTHSYIQQYLERGIPKWLPEPIREALVATYGLDAARLRPPPLQLHKRFDVNSQAFHKLKHDPSAIELLAIFGELDEKSRTLVVEMMRKLGGRRSERPDNGAAAA